MACNCGKNRRRRAAATPKPKPNRDTTGGSNDSSQQQKTGSTQSFALITSGGRTTFGSRLEADAANARLGGIGTVRPA